MGLDSHTLEPRATILGTPTSLRILVNANDVRIAACKIGESECSGNEEKHSKITESRIYKYDIAGAIEIDEALRGDFTTQREFSNVS